MFQSKIRTITPWYVFYPSVTLAHFKLSLSTLVLLNSRLWSLRDHSVAQHGRPMEAYCRYIHCNIFIFCQIFFFRKNSRDQNLLIWYDLFILLCRSPSSMDRSEPSSKMGFLRGISLAFFLKKTEEKPAVKGSKYTGRNVKASLWPWHEDVFKKKKLSTHFLSWFGQSAIRSCQMQSRISWMFLSMKDCSLVNMWSQINRK